MNLTEKKKIVENLQDRFSKTSIVIVTDYKGLDVATINDLRRKLREENVEFQVVKNTLLTRASAETDVGLIKEYFKGSSAVALSYDDPIAPAKVLTNFAKDHEELEIKGGVLNGQVLELNDIKTLSTMPSRDQLLGKLVSTLNAVPASFVRTLSEILIKLLYVLLAVKEQREAD
ncbi:MAG: 50S ribosomal protein L10 [Desulfobacterales bacterium]|nr:MAG: 50S ribosomal protein L10 [Desulfobacterales bacterium]